LITGGGISTGHTTLTADDFIYTPGTGRMRLAWEDLWRPSHGTCVDLTQVEQAILNVHQRFRLARLAVDPYQADLLITRLGKHHSKNVCWTRHPGALCLMADLNKRLYNSRCEGMRELNTPVLPV
jgi:hypothetical protein